MKIRKIVRTEWSDIDLSLDNIMEVCNTKQMSWVFRVPKNARKLIIKSEEYKGIDNKVEKHTGYCWEIYES